MTDPMSRVFVCRKCGRIISECKVKGVEPTFEEIDACAVCEHRQKTVK